MRARASGNLEEFSQPAGVTTAADEKGVGKRRQKRAESEVVEGCRGQERGAKPAYRLVSSVFERKVSPRTSKSLVYHGEPITLPGSWLVDCLPDCLLGRLTASRAGLVSSRLVLFSRRANILLVTRPRSVSLRAEPFHVSFVVIAFTISVMPWPTRGGCR